MKTKLVTKNTELLIMGILNITPDSFSDGGLFFTKRKALKHAKKLIEDGADIIDIGGESTGPGSKKVNQESELKRILWIIKEIKKIKNIPISIDTYNSKTAEACLNAGADIINDVSGLRGDKKMASVAAKYNCPIVIMYSKDKTPRTTIKNKSYKDVIKEISSFFQERLEFAKAAGIKKTNIILDPGMGHYISSNRKYSFEIISRLSEFKKLKTPILVGISRKSFIGGAKPEERDNASAALSLIAYLNGARIIRTHNVKSVKNLITQ